MLDGGAGKEDGRCHVEEQILDEHHIGSLHSNISTRATSAPVPTAMPTSACASAGASLIKAVAGHGNALADGLELTDVVALVGGEDLGKHVVDPHALRSDK